MPKHGSRTDTMSFAKKIRAEFPIFEEHPKMVYLDHGATSLKPKIVGDRVRDYYLKGSANIHRGIYRLSEQATSDFEKVRIQVKDFIHASSENEIVFTSGTTDASNIVVMGLAQNILKAGDQVIVTQMDHHANIVPWQLLQEKIDFKIEVIRLSDDATLDMDHYKSLLNERTKFVAIPMVSNVLGVSNPVAEICSLARSVGALSVIDAAQAVSHHPVDVQNLNCDFLMFSGHKLFGPTGIGVLYGQHQALDRITPVRGGGDMIRKVSFSGTTYADLPSRLEAGTPHIAGVLGLGAAIDFVQEHSWQDWQKHEQDLFDYCKSSLADLSFVSDLGSQIDSSVRDGVFPLTVKGVHPHDVAAIMDKENVCMRAGHLCAMPLLDNLKSNGVVRASFGVYNSRDDIDKMVLGLKKVWEFFGE